MKYFGIWVVLLFISKQCQSLKYVNPVSYFEDNGPLLYDEVGTIVYRFFCPSRDLESMLVTNPSCSSPSNPDSGYCPLIYHLIRVSEMLKPLITAPTSFHQSKQRLKKFDCGGPVTQYFTSEYSSPDLVDDYINELIKCDESGNKTVIHDPNFDFSMPFNGFYETAHVGYDTVYYSASDSSEKHFKAIHAVALAAIDAAGQVHFLAEALRWKEAAADCRAKLIPRPLITEQMLMSSVQQLFSKLTSTDFTLAIPNIDTAIGTYFSSPLVDCTFSAEELVISVSIPLKLRQSDSKLVSLAAIPFRHSFQNQMSICFVEQFQDEQFFLHDRVSKELAVNHQCDRDSLHCHFQRESKQFKKFLKTCQSAIFKGSAYHEISKYCPLKCIDENEFYLPILYNHFGKIYFVGRTSDSCRIICPRKSTILFNGTDEGALEINLPCGCNIVINDQVYASGKEPCSSVLSVEQVLPVHFMQF